MEDLEPELLEWAEDTCEVCGAHVGYGVRLFHLDRCDEHLGEEEPNSSDVVSKELFKRAGNLK